MVWREEFVQCGRKANSEYSPLNSYEPHELEQQMNFIIYSIDVNIPRSLGLSLTRWIKNEQKQITPIESVQSMKVVHSELLSILHLKDNSTM